MRTADESYSGGARHIPARHIPLHRRTALDYADRYGEYEALHAVLVDVIDELTDLIRIASQRILTTTSLRTWREDIETIGDREATTISLPSVENRRPQTGVNDGTIRELAYKTAVRDELVTDVATVFAELVNIYVGLTVAAKRLWLSPARPRAVYAAALSADGTLPQRMYRIERTLKTVIARALQEL